MDGSKNFLDDLPQRSISHDIEQSAVRAFEEAIEQSNLFIIQRADKNDYGTDVQLEARIGTSMTNTRIHVQLKGTAGNLNTDGSVSIPVDRENLNYLLRQPLSIYVCYHTPSKSLFIQVAEDTLRQYEQKALDWRSQKTLTIKFRERFTVSFQQRLHALSIASGKSARDQRLQWALASPEQIPKLVNNAVPVVDLSGSPQRDYEILLEMYRANQDAAISASFSKFEAALAHIPAAISLAYMSEINLGINGYQFDEERVRKAIPLLERVKSSGNDRSGDLEYCIANAYVTLGECESAIHHYKTAINELDPYGSAHELAMCHKNMGAAYKVLGKHNDERESYQKAIELDAELSEAKFALAVCMHNDGEYQEALSQLDSIVWNADSLVRLVSVQAWRVSVFFNLHDPNAAFREINGLLSHADRFEWIFPWCAKLVWQFGKHSIEAIPKALSFWKKYLRQYPDDIKGNRERLLCLWRLHENGQEVDLDYDTFRQEMLSLIDAGDPDPAFIWDRIGHWAQTDGMWEKAGEAYRVACESDPDEYGYCLGVAMKNLGNYLEALPILLDQAKNHQPDELSWINVAETYEALGNADSCTTAYRKAIEIAPERAESWFNLGGSLLNLGFKDHALDIWEEAVARFPDHELVDVLIQFLEGGGPAFGGVRQEES